MKRAYIRSSLFNVLFIIVNIICCLLWIPTLILPRRLFVKTLYVYDIIMWAIEYVVLGLNYTVEGQEHLPKDGAFLVAAKHMSTYETFKLRLLFDDPAIILKKELLKIPLWGLYLKKSGIIAIDRSTPKQARQSINEGALEIKEQGRPIVIYPQGTRVWADDTPKEKPYKSGIFGIQEQTKLPIIPMATNSGLFWPRSGWLKSSGTVTFKFLPAIKSSKATKATIMKKIETTLETESNDLMDKTRNTQKKEANKTLFAFLSIALAITLLSGLIGGYSYLWFKGAEQIKSEYVTLIRKAHQGKKLSIPTQISGFPGPITLTSPGERFSNDIFTLDIKRLTLKTWPLPFLPARITTGEIKASFAEWNTPITFEELDIGLKALPEDILQLDHAILRKDPLRANLSGIIDLTQSPIPGIDTTIELSGFTEFIHLLTQRGHIDKLMASFIRFGLGGLSDDDGVVRAPLTQRGNKLYIGPMPIADLSQLLAPQLPVQEEPPAPLIRQAPYNQLGLGQ